MCAGRHGRRARGVTLVELAIGVVLVAALLGVTYKVFSYITNARKRGSVDLQELQGARFAINHLRRDFRCATPFIPKSATLTQKAKAFEMPIVDAKTFTKGDSTIPVLVSPAELHFHRQMYDTPDLTTSPVLEEVNYHIDEARNCLIRTTAGRELAFPGIRNVKFELYGHPLDPGVPMLLVTLTVDADPSKGAKTPDLEITSTLSSSVINQNIHQRSWNRLYY
ncbi:MAG TPA: hypothetical protein PLP29_18875 [Candidatus Ozemobacteraceae bacterium]|nr:hypothetical protein [Candidatus Ozemobacteraceae bacterium]